MTDRAEYICTHCSAKYKRRVICEGPICRRCTAMCKVVPIGEQEPQEWRAKMFGDVLARAVAQGRIRLERKASTR